MHFRTVALAVLLALLALFAMLNWAAFMAPTALTLGFADVNAPLGLVMLVATGVVSAAFLLYILFQQGAMLLEARRTATELKDQRALADQAEASRFTELRTYLEAELRKLEAQGSTAQQALLAGTETLAQGLQHKLDESSRSVAAHLGEIEDKLDRVLAGPLQT